MKLIIYIISFILLINKTIAQNEEGRVSVFFNTDDFVIRYDSLPAIQVSEGDSIFIEAHCDSRGSEVYNLGLAEKRANSVLHYLKSKGNLKENQIYITGIYGESRPTGNNSTAEGRQVNRRVDIIIRRQPEEQLQQSIAKPLREIATDTVENTLSDKLKASIGSGKNIRLDNLLFKPGLDIVLEQSEPVLYDLLKLMQENQGLEIELQGYVCCTPAGSDGENLRTGSASLSEDRARAVFDFLVAKGIDPVRMQVKGYGGSNKIADPERSLSDQNANRRVEIKILKY
jgi:outer membrane protein OmpA-like peptidoglycan-associated protein